MPLHQGKLASGKICTQVPIAVVHGQVQDAVRQMADVIAAYESAADTSDMETARAEFEPVLSACLQPILTACQKSAEALALDAPSRSAPINGSLVNGLKMQE